MAFRVALVLAVSSSIVAATACVGGSGRATLPTALGNQEFWRLSDTLSEPPGEFKHSDNLVSNEGLFAHTIQLLRPIDGVYIGVGPEQNFSYIARLEPAMAFIIDIREENRHLHLMYKALFELSDNRADFVSRLFSRERPAGLDEASSVDDLFKAYAAAPPSDRLYDTTGQLVAERLLNARALPLSVEDVASIHRIRHAFYVDGPEIQYGRTLPPTAAGPSYRTLMTARDVRGQRRSYLATEDTFLLVRDLHARNLIVPVVGDFSGPTAIRHVGDYLRQQHSRLAAFYSSNVQVYLSNQQMAAYCGNLGTLPYDARTWYIFNKGHQKLSAKLAACK